MWDNPPPPNKQHGTSFLCCCVWGVQSSLVALFRIQVMLLQDSAQRQRDQQNTVFILSLPVVIAVVPAGSLPSALPPDQTPRQCRTFSAQKCKQAAESCTLCCTGRHEGDITEESNIYYCFRFGYQDGYCVTIKQKLYCTYIYTHV